jgi:hypothetical protein
MDVCLCVLSVRGLCDELITRPEDSYRLWRVVVYDHETSCYKEAIARAGVVRENKYLKKIPVGARFFAHVQTGHGVHPASCTVGNR